MAEIPSKTSDFYYVNDAGFGTTTYYFLLLRMPELHQQYISGHTAVKKRLVQQFSALPSVS
jgi:hypothetical protein